MNTVARRSAPIRGALPPHSRSSSSSKRPAREERGMSKKEEDSTLFPNISHSRLPPPPLSNTKRIVKSAAGGERRLHPSRPPPPSSSRRKPSARPRSQIPEEETDNHRFEDFLTLQKQKEEKEISRLNEKIRNIRIAQYNATSSPPDLETKNSDAPRSTGPTENSFPSYDYEKGVELFKSRAYAPRPSHPVENSTVHSSPPLLASSTVSSVTGTTNRKTKLKEHQQQIYDPSLIAACHIIVQFLRMAVQRKRFLQYYHRNQWMKREPSLPGGDASRLQSPTPLLEDTPLVNHHHHHDYEDEDSALLQQKWAVLVIENWRLALLSQSPRSPKKRTTSTASSFSPPPSSLSVVLQAALHLQRVGRAYLIRRHPLSSLLRKKRDMIAFIQQKIARRREHHALVIQTFLRTKYSQGWVDRRKKANLKEALYVYQHVQQELEEESYIIELRRDQQERERKYYQEHVMRCIVRLQSYFRRYLCQHVRAPLLKSRESAHEYNERRIAFENKENWASDRKLILLQEHTERRSIEREEETLFTALFWAYDRTRNVYNSTVPSFVVSFIASSKPWREGEGGSLK